jgi:hypothetical protein
LIDDTKLTYILKSRGFCYRTKIWYFKVPSRSRLFSWGFCVFAIVDRIRLIRRNQLLPLRLKNGKPGSPDYKHVCQCTWQSNHRMTEVDSLSPLCCLNSTCTRRRAIQSVRFANCPVEVHSGLDLFVLIWHSVSTCAWSYVCHNDLRTSLFCRVCRIWRCWRSCLSVGVHC